MASLKLSDYITSEAKEPVKHWAKTHYLSLSLWAVASNLALDTWITVIHKIKTKI